MWTTVEYVKCGKRNCGTCPHGPYKYEWWREHGRLRKRYAGRVHSATQDNPRPKPATQDDAIFSRRTATAEIAYRILGIKPPISSEALRTQYMKLVKVNHPDAGGDSRTFERIAAAYSWLRR